MSERLKARRKMKKVGDLINTEFLVYVNNEEPSVFPNRHAVESYLKQFRENTEIFSMQLFRIETYSL